MISNDVPSLELCKKLRDLGWKKETMFWQVELESPELRYEIHYKATWDFRLGNPTIPAPTVGEMMEAIPCTMEIRKLKELYPCELAVQFVNRREVFKADKFSNCFAMLLIHLLEHNLVKLEEKE